MLAIDVPVEHEDHFVGSRGRPDHERRAKCCHKKSHHGFPPVFMFAAKLMLQG
jgi:hypothetical protein